MIKDNEFFIGLPQGKVKGFCEPPESDIYNSVVVDIENDCLHCQTPRCHMFDAVIREGEIVGRVFIKHTPEY